MNEDLAGTLATEIMKDLGGRSGILDDVEPEIQEEMEDELRRTLHSRLSFVTTKAISETLVEERSLSSEARGRLGGRILARMGLA